jgi:hypothetical protein
VAGQFDVENYPHWKIEFVVNKIFNFKGADGKELHLALNKEHHGWFVYYQDDKNPCYRIAFCIGEGDDVKWYVYRKEAECDIKIIKFQEEFNAMEITI